MAAQREAYLASGEAQICSETAGPRRTPRYVRSDTILKSAQAGRLDLIQSWTLERSSGVKAEQRGTAKHFVIFKWRPATLAAAWKTIYSFGSHWIL
eukprot:7892646-Pyramimonas_sp.AAC.1